VPDIITFDSIVIGKYSPLDIYLVLIESFVLIAKTMLEHVVVVNTK